MTSLLPSYTSVHRPALPEDEYEQISSPRTSPSPRYGSKEQLRTKWICSKWKRLFTLTSAHRKLRQAGPGLGMQPCTERLSEAPSEAAGDRYEISPISLTLFSSQQNASCTQSDAAVYQVSARNREGMICCSASVEVQCLQDAQVSPDPGGARDVVGKHETERHEGDDIKPTDEKWSPCKGEESVGGCMSADSSPHKSSHSWLPQREAMYDSGASNSENPLDVKETRQRIEPYNSNNTQDNSFHSDNTTKKQDVCQHRTGHATEPGLTGGDLGSKGANEEDVTPRHQNPKAQKYISFSLPLPEATLCPYPGDSNSITVQHGPQVSSEDSDSDYELCPEITLTYTEEFSDDDLEYLECSDVMTDYSNAVWQSSLLGTDRVFLLESDDEEMALNECGPGGREHFLSEMGCGPRVSGDMGPTNATTGLCPYHSQPQEVGVRSSGASRHSPLPQHAGMTLTLGPHQDGTAKMTEPGRTPLPTASEAVGHDCPGIRGETRDNPEAGEEFSSDSLQTMDKAETEAGVRPSSGGLEKSEVKQGLKSLAGERADEKHPGGRKAAPRPTRARRPGMKANAKKQLLKDNSPKDTLDLLPKEPTRHPLTGNYGQEPTHTEAGAAGWNSHFHEEPCIPLPAEHDTKTPRPPADPLPKEGDTSLGRRGELFNQIFEASQIADQIDHLQLQIQETTGERSDLEQMPAFSLPAGEESSFTGTTTNVVSNLSEINQENASLAQHLDLEVIPQGLQQEARQSREGHRPGALWAERAHEWSTPEGNDEEVPQTQGSESPQSTYESSRNGKAAESPLSNGAFTGDTWQEASGDAVGETPSDLGTSPSIFSSTDLYDFGGLGETQPLGENGSFADVSKGGCKSSNLSVPGAIDTLPDYSSVGGCPREPSAESAASVDCHQVTRETEEDTLADATSVHTISCHTISALEDSNLVDGDDQASCEAREANDFESLSNIQPGRSLSSSTSEMTREMFIVAPSIPGACGHFLLPERQDLWSAHFQTDKQPGHKSQLVEGDHGGSLEEDFQEKGSERKQCTSHQRSLSANDFQENLPPIPGTQQEVKAEPFEHPLADSGEEIGQSTDPRTSVSVAAEKTMEDDKQLPSHELSNAPSLPDILLEEKEDIGLGSWAAVSKVKIITLEAPDFETWQPEQAMHYGSKEAEVGLTAPNRGWALSDILRAGANRDAWAGEAPARCAYYSSLSSQCLDQPRLLESSVDPVEEAGLEVTVSPLEATRSGETESVETRNEDQEGNERKIGGPAFFRQFVNGPSILESSVDPIDGRRGMECVWSEKPEPSHSNTEGNESTDRYTRQRADIQPATLQVPHPQNSGEIIPNESTINQNHTDREKADAKQSQADKAKAEAQAALCQAQCPGEERQRIPSVCNMSQDGSDRGLGEAGQVTKDKAELISPMTSLSSCLRGATPASVEVETNDTTSHIHGNVTRLSISRGVEELKSEEIQIVETKPLTSSHSPAKTLAFISEDCESEKAPEGLLKDLCQKGSAQASREKSREEQQKHVLAQTSKAPGARSATAGPEEDKKKQEASGSGHLAAGVKKKILSRVAALRLRLEERENMRKNSILKKTPKFEKSLSHTDEKKDSQKAPCKAEGKAPVLLKKIQAEMAPDRSGNVKLSCQFAEIHEDSTICWTKDSQSIAQVKRSAGDNSSVSLAIVQAGQKDQGLYYCCLKNSYGKVTAEFNLTAEVLKQLSSRMEYRGCEEIEFSQLIFKEDVFNDSYFGDHLRGQISTEELHLGEGVHRKAFRSTVMQGLMPVFQPGHACVLKVHNAVAHGTRNNDELVQRNYKLAAQVATVEEELIGEFVKYSIRDGKEINFLRRDSEAGQKCCTFQHWVYQKTSGCLLVTDMQGVGMKLTDVGIATLAKGYKGFKGNCSMTFIDQFKALHQCNKYCKMLGLKSLQNNSQKPKKTSIGRGRAQTNPASVKTPEPGTPTEKKA
ncbi:Alpha-protein kinase 2 [Microtus ochrogaster]|uniref:Alpha-protein kinase 2 n=1 Tax=Microtus ochrogaster TaxID=79684 RepID=A0A8J6GLF2_MICOH|nr:Alpha-protein kinase 2 [Microtus ochrogaster]